MDPLVTLPADSDLKAAEALYTADQLADAEFVYREMLMLRGVVSKIMADNVRRLERYGELIAEARATFTPEVADQLADTLQLLVENEAP